MFKREMWDLGDAGTFYPYEYKFLEDRAEVCGAWANDVDKEVPAILTVYYVVDYNPETKKSVYVVPESAVGLKQLSWDDWDIEEVNEEYCVYWEKEKEDA